MVEEIADKKFNGDILNSVVIPLMANNRIAMNGKIDPHEKHKSEIYVKLMRPHVVIHVENPLNCWKILRDQLTTT